MSTNFNEVQSPKETNLSILEAQNSLILMLQLVLIPTNLTRPMQHKSIHIKTSSDLTEFITVCRRVMYTHSWQIYLHFDESEWKFNPAPRVIEWVCRVHQRVEMWINERMNGLLFGEWKWQENKESSKENQRKTKWSSKHNFSGPQNRRC